MSPISDDPDHDDVLLSEVEETFERDDLTEDMFGGAPEPVVKSVEVSPPGTASEAYTVLARKYRPRTFEDLIGQEAMVRTLTNAFSTGRIAHAFMLTGVRGVGKTTTARLLARALNFESDTVKSPSVDLTTFGYHCQAIIEGRHIDVLELDAASRTGVDAMRELLESVRYAPVEARYKVYVIDEVHMLSTGAFNALLKTLEEPPPHAKFIFATTEIRKVPVTILSRCQRFDLRRVEPEILTPHLEKICGLEGVRIEPEAIALIARAAEGSVRDSLSLLDQALVQGQGGQIVAAAGVRDMLGLADRTATLQLFENIVSGQVSDALLSFRNLYGFGADPSQIMGDMLEYAHAASVGKVLGADATRLPKEPALRLTAIGAELSAGTLSRLWTLLLKAFEEVRRAPDPAAAAEMAIVRFCYASDLPGPELLMKRLQSGEPLLGGGGTPAPSGGGGPQARGGAMVQARAQAQAKPVLNTFNDVLALIESKRDIGLRLDVERYVKLIAFQPGAITYEPAPNAPGDLGRRLSVKLKEWTGERWLIASQQGGGGADTIHDIQKRDLKAARDAVEQDPFMASLLQAFPGAKLVSLRAKPVPIQSVPIAPVTENSDENPIDEDAND